MTEPAEWLDAACRGKPLWWWFPSVGGKRGRFAPGHQARAVCAECPREADCVAWAIRQGPDLHGIWGGLNPGERATELAWRRRHGGLPVCELCGSVAASLEALRRHSQERHGRLSVSVSHPAQRMTTTESETRC